jgi:hypothetical protein
MTTTERQANRESFFRARWLGAPVWQQTSEDGSDVRVYPFGPTDRPRFVLLAFLGTAGKPAVYVSYRTAPDAIAAGEQTLTNQTAHRDRIAKARAERAAVQTTMQVGTVLSSSWGYDQTNVDYYEVVGVSASRQTVTIRPIAQRTVEDGPLMTGCCWPVAGEYIGPARTHRVGPGESVKVRDWGVWARPWAGTLDRWTAYA